MECKHPILYEISTRPWLYELSKKYGKSIKKLKDIPLEEFDYLKDNGIEIVWMMGVWKLGEYGLEFDRKSDYSGVLPGWTSEDVIGSPYAIAEYTCNPDIGTDDDLVWLREQLHSRNMKLMLDFVPNHSAVDAPTAESTQNYMFVHLKELKMIKRYTNSGLAYGKDPYFDPWRDVIQWKYGEGETRKFMKDNLMTVLSFADGVRCDMAHLMLNDVFGKTWAEELNAWGYTKPENEFWEYAFKEVKAKYPKAIFLAEVYEDWEIELLYKLGFTYTYDKVLLDKLEGSPYDVNDYIHYKTESYWGHTAHFVENHDENRAVYNMGTIEKAKAAGTIAATLGGMIFMNHGQWSGYRNKLDVHLRRGADEMEDGGVRKYYERLMPIVLDPAFTGTNYYFVYNMSGERKNDFVAYLREEDDSHYLVVVNYSGYFWMC
uniref:Amylase n=1 Tax=Eudiplodinium maggii TaxID=47892 RepID=B7FBK9_9CILI|nr:amylase [Eudiplodinium maggii]